MYGAVELYKQLQFIRLGGERLCSLLRSADRGNPETRQSYRTTPEAKGSKLTGSQYTVRMYAQKQAQQPKYSKHKQTHPFFSFQERLEQSQRLKQV